ncbi:Aldo/keto reductase, partial [Coccomyxa subellipsoidea C-169]
VTLNNGVVMPLVGFGTAGLGAATEEATAWALASGYRLLDSAQAQEWYREDLVGLAVLKSRVPREQVFLTSKLHPRHHGREEAMIQFTKSLSALAVEQVDLFLLHYPECWPGLCGEGFTPKGTWHDSWRALEDLVDKGLVRAIGVSNFGIDELAELLAMARIKPALVQRHSDPLAADAEVRAFCRLAGIQYQGYSTLGSQWLMRGMDENPVLTNPVVDRVANETGRDAAQVVLRWALQHGQGIVPRSSKKERIAANRDLDFVLSADQMHRIDFLDGSLLHTV